MPSQAFLTVQEVADLIRHTPHTVRLMCQRGDIEARKIGTKWIIPKDALLDRLGVHDADEV